MDGFSGNVLLKSSEAAAKLLADILKEKLTSSLRNKIGALLAKPALIELKQALNPDEVGAAPLLGVNGLVFIGHGRSNPQALFSAIRTARQSVQANLLEEIQFSVEEKLGLLN
jgi:glycerol-3-phosphate acyltransferase PlsX